MTRKKREQRDQRRVAKGLSPKETPTSHAHLEEVDDPSFPPTYGNGFKLVITESMALVRRPFSFLKFGAFFYFFYFLAMMFIAYMLNGFVSLQGLNLTEKQQMLLNMTFLEIGKLFITPAFLLPWFAATWVFRRGGQVEIRWISEILKYRTTDLILMGLFSVLFVGFIGYVIQDFLDFESLLWPSIISLTLYGLFQFYIHQLMLMLWDSEERPWKILGSPLKLWAHSWKMILGMITGLFLCLLSVILLFMTLIGTPIMVMNIPLEHLQWMGFVLLPISIWLFIQWQALKARLLYLLYLSHIKPESNPE